MIDVPEAPHQPREPRRVIPATCTPHSGARGYTNLVVTKRGGHLELDPHVTGQCVIMLDEDSARVLVGVRGGCPLQRRGWRSQRVGRAGRRQPAAWLLRRWVRALGATVGAT